MVSNLLLTFLQECCGIYSYKDYQLLFYPLKHTTPVMINSTSGDGRVLKEFPISCCSWYHGKEVGNDGVPGAATKKKLDSAQTHCIIELGRISTTRAAANLSATYVEYDWETKVYNNSGVEGPNFPIFFNEDKRPMVHTNVGKKWKFSRFRANFELLIPIFIDILRP